MSDHRSIMWIIAGMVLQVREKRFDPSLF